MVHGTPVLRTPPNVSCEVKFEISIQRPGDYIFTLEMMCPGPKIAETLGFDFRKSMMASSFRTAMTASGHGVGNLGTLATHRIMTR